jgi:Domain of unknown function (DUF6894)
MPRYFFHLRFGQRVVRDEEGIELPNRSAARDEAVAVVYDLANPEPGSNSRRWASWFLEVADEGGGFFRTPIGHPALEVVTPDSGASPKRAPRSPTRSAAVTVFPENTVGGNRPRLKKIVQLLSPGELAMTRSTSELAACSSASASFFFRSALAARGRST